jgi:hypothetical protein
MTTLSSYHDNPVMITLSCYHFIMTGLSFYHDNVIMLSFFSWKLHTLTCQMLLGVSWITLYCTVQVHGPRSLQKTNVDAYIFICLFNEKFSQTVECRVLYTIQMLLNGTVCYRVKNAAIPSFMGVGFKQIPVWHCPARLSVSRCIPNWAKYSILYTRCTWHKPSPRIFYSS